MSVTLVDVVGFNPVAAEWARRAPARRSAARAAVEAGGAVGYRGGPLPGLPGAMPTPTRWRESLLRWLAEMPREMPPRQ